MPYPVATAPHLFHEGFADVWPTHEADCLVSLASFARRLQNGEAITKLNPSSISVRPQNRSKTMPETPTSSMLR